ncbi:MAG: hypothetical protein K6G89_06810 [Clostridia bacterium]|nr:hypothetical protein [Clostridia bacterium]
MKRSELYDVIAGLDEKIQEDAYELRNRPKKPTFNKKAAAVIAASVTLVLAATVLLTVLIFRKGYGISNTGNNGHVISNASVGGNSALNIRLLSYSGLEDLVYTLNAENFGPRLISAKAKGIHEKCCGVFYDQSTGKIICLEHEFLQASGMTLPEGSYLVFYTDITNDKLAAVEVKDSLSDNTDVWILDRNSGSAMHFDLPEGCSDYTDIGLHSSCLMDGILCVDINSKAGRHCLRLYNVSTGEAVDRFEDDEASFIAGGFLSRDVLELYESGERYFYNVKTGAKVKLIGEFNYCFSKKVYSVKNWGGAYHKDVIVKAYDADTGEILENENVLVQTMLEGGKSAILLKNSSSGEETVIMEDVTHNCCGWSKDHSCFYAYSEKTGKLICYYTENQTWDTAVIESADKTPVVIDGKTYAVYANYSLAIGERQGDVTVYYARILAEVSKAPDYEDEKVSSPYWSEYCDIKFRNFANEKSFEYATKNGINLHDGYVYGTTIYDMDLLRDVILECLENKGPLYEPEDPVNAEYVMIGYLFCGSLRIIFYECGDDLYITMPRNVSPLEEYDSNPYLFPREVFVSIEERLIDKMK